MAYTPALDLTTLFEVIFKDLGLVLCLDVSELVDILLDFIKTIFWDTKTTNKASHQPLCGG